MTAELIKILKFIDIVIIFPTVCWLAIIYTFRIIKFSKKLTLDIERSAFVVACIHTIILIIALFNI